MILLRSPRSLLALMAVAATLVAPSALAQRPAPNAGADPRLERLKAEALTLVDGKSKMVQEIVDMLFSFGELGFQEFETSKYLTGILEQNGFTVERGVAGMPTAWVARWGSGKPVIALGSDIDGIPQANQKPGVGYREALVNLAPGHGEGHNSGQAVNIAAALVVKQLMERERIPGTLMLWPGVAEEQLGTKAHFVRAGLFKDVDANIFTHVSSDLGVSWGASGQNAMVSVEFRFRGQTAHSAGAPWRGKSALDAVMLMAQASEYRREHLELAQRTHYVITDGGDQPNVVPQTASIWYFLRHVDYDNVMRMLEQARRMAQGAALMTDTQLDTMMIIGSAWNGHFNRAIAEAMHANIRRVGLPKWDEADLTMARGLQRELGVRESGLATQVNELRGSSEMSNRTGGGSDDIGDISWNVPTVTLRYPSNIPGGPGHNWANAIAMATPIAHKGAVAGAKVEALTILDMLLTPKVVADAWDYFNNVQTKEQKYTPFIRPVDQPAIWLNADIMAKYRDEMRKYYYDPTKFRTYLEQLGIKYPTVKPIAQ
ncbi:MAG TPA: amidohydrolase [Gemmatimonadaceae bacterium]|nr:amidohydrolase [Gemmatimonadaceae bacterium]